MKTTDVCIVELLVLTCGTPVINLFVNINYKCQISCSVWNWVGKQVVVSSRELSVVPVYLTDHFLLTLISNLPLPLA